MGDSVGGLTRGFWMLQGEELLTPGGLVRVYSVPKLGGMAAAVGPQDVFVATTNDDDRDRRIALRAASILLDYGALAWPVVPSVDDFP